MSITPELYEFIVRVVEEMVRDIRVTREEFDKLVERVDRLAEVIDRLAEAQAKTEERVDKLAKRRLSETVGFGLEDIAKVVLPGWLQRHLGVDLYGEGSRRGEKVLVLGECKSRIGKRDVARFYDKVYKPIASKAEVVGVLFGYLIRPEGGGGAGLVHHGLLP